MIDSLLRSLRMRFSNSRKSLRVRADGNLLIVTNLSKAASWNTLKIQLHLKGKISKRKLSDGICYIINMVEENGIYGLECCAQKPVHEVADLLNRKIIFINNIEIDERSLAVA